jgi:hypothetical protein
LCPSARSMAATAEESTPPDMATAIVFDDMVSIVNGCVRTGLILASER